MESGQPIHGHDQNHTTERYLRWVLLALSLALAILLIFLFFQYRALRRAQLASDYKFHASQFLERHAPLSASAAGDIRTWMTFEYINKVFALPAIYLQTQLRITDPRYPRVTLSSYASGDHIDAAALLNEVENAVRGYPSSTNSTSSGV